MSTIKYRALSPTGDYTFGFGNTCFVTDSEAVRQAVQTKLKMFKNEYWEDLNDGLPFFQTMAGSFDKNAIDMAVKERILETPHVTGIKTFKSEITAYRKYIMYATVDTDFGTVSAEVT